MAIDGKASQADKANKCCPEMYEIPIVPSDLTPHNVGTYWKNDFGEVVVIINCFLTSGYFTINSNGLIVGCLPEGYRPHGFLSMPCYLQSSKLGMEAGKVLIYQDGMIGVSQLLVNQSSQLDTAFATFTYLA